MTANEREYLREMAKRIHELANQPRMPELRKKWYALNNGDTNEPLVVMKYHGVYEDVYPKLKCENELARQIEGYMAPLLTEAAWEDDRVIEDTFPVYVWNGFVPYGLRFDRTVAKDENGKPTMGYAAQHLIKDLEDDFHLLGKSEWHVDEGLKNAKKRQQDIQEIVGDILPVSIQFPSMALSLAYPLCELMGMEAMLCALYDSEDKFHEAMEMQTNDLLAYMDEIEQKQALLCNGNASPLNQDSYGYTNDLPENPDRLLTLRDCWGYANSQETVGISPEMFEEFFFTYFRRYAERFGLFAFGCCEPVDVIWDKSLSTLKNLRKISVSPWCNEHDIAEKIRGTKIVYHRKPSPNLFAMPGFDEDTLATQLRATVEAARGCPLEFTFRDITSVHGDPSRLNAAVKIARREIDKHWKP